METVKKTYTLGGAAALISSMTLPACHDAQKAFFARAAAAFCEFCRWAAKAAAGEQPRGAVLTHHVTHDGGEIFSGYLDLAYFDGASRRDVRRFAFTFVNGRLWGADGDSLAAALSNAGCPRSDIRRADRFDCWYENGKLYHTVPARDTKTGSQPLRAEIAEHN